MSHEHAAEDERFLLHEQIRDLTEAAKEEQTRRARLAEVESLYVEIAAKTPASCHTRLRAFLTTQLLDDGSAYYDSWLAPFCDDLRRLGLVRGVLYNIDQDDADAKERRRGHMNRLPDPSLAWEFIRFALDHEEDGYWRDVAFKWISAYAPDRENAVALLTAGLRRGSAIAALRLSELAPDTPGLVESLQDALSSDWIASNYRSFGEGVGGAGFAAEALARLGQRARPARSRLRESALTERNDFHSGADRRLAFAAYVELGATDDEIRELLEEAAQRRALSDEFLAAVVQVVRGKPELGTSLCRLIQCRFWEEYSDYSDKRGWIEAMALLGAQDGGAEIVLPALAAALSREPDLSYRIVNYHALARDAAATFLARLFARAENLSREDVFVRSVKGTAATDSAWLVYADWLEEQGEPRAEWLRLRYALASANRSGELWNERRARHDAWLTDHGRGWAVLYDLIGG